MRFGNKNLAQRGEKALGEDRQVVVSPVLISGFGGVLIETS
jgi:hypothetical protein